MSKVARLLIADSEHDADMLYIAGLFVPDPFAVVGLNGQWHGLFSSLEIDRARKSSKLNHAHLDFPWREKARKLGWEGGPEAAAAAFLHEHGIHSVMTPGNFPLLCAERMRAWGIGVQPNNGSLFPERAVKSLYEINQLRKAERLTRQAMRTAEQLLAAAEIGDDGILRHPETGRRLKSGHVRGAIETFLISHGANPSHTIVACGRETADPHQIGQGYIRARQPIIIDIFPRLLASGYWGDMTRSYVKGKADARLLKLYRTVREGQDIGLSMVADGVHGRDIHHAITRHFDSCGFYTGSKRGRQTGFFHGTGHGVGLDVHEPPRISVSDHILHAGNVVTVEPGLYYPGLGGVRLEDMVVVRKNSCENLTHHPRRMVIP